MTGPYYVQCVTGDPDHIMQVIDGSELAKKCEEREEAGQYGALCLDFATCPGCIEFARKRVAWLSEDFNCVALDGVSKCEGPCPCEKQYPDSPYADQLMRVEAIV